MTAAYHLTGAWRLQTPDSRQAPRNASITTFEADEIEVLIAVKDGDQPVDLTGATVEVVFARGGTVIAGAPVIEDAAGGGIGVPIPALDAGIWRMQVRVAATLPWPDRQTVYDGPVTVRRSL